jgi:oxygen-dependent protoporphyrinogen oxidase
MESLIRAAAHSLGSSLRTSHTVAEVRPRRDARASGPRLVGARAFTVVSTGRSIEADAVVLAGPASETADLLRPFDPEAARHLNGIPTAPLAVICLGYDAHALEADRGPLDGFGFLVPRGEGPRILGALWESSIYPGRAPEGKALIRVMIGGATDRDVLDLDDTAIVDLAREDLRRTMGLRTAPEFTHLVRHRRGIPQYTIGHLSRVDRIETRLREYPGLFLAGNSYRGVSINACLEDALLIAQRVATHLQRVVPFAEYADAR